MKKIILLAFLLALLAGCEKQNNLESESTSTPTPTPTPIATITDICGNTYPIVTIGTQTWMAENLRCDKYDTKSEAYNASWLINNAVPIAVSNVYTPYYTDGTNKTNWSTTRYADHLSSEQISKLGYHYNWAAAVGVENGQNKTSDFSGKRQGICPNGWHVPSHTEWVVLYKYVYNDQGLSSDELGRCLKSTSGWYENGNGTDNYGLAILPSGNDFGGSVGSVGYCAYFCTSTPNSSRSNFAYCRCFEYDKDSMYGSPNFNKNCGHSVRCVKN